MGEIQAYKNVHISSLNLLEGTVRETPSSHLLNKMITKMDSVYVANVLYT